MKERAYSKNIANAINTFLKEDDWHFSFNERRGVFRFGLSLTSKLKKINYFIDVKEDEYIVYVTPMFGADKDDRAMMAAMAEFVCRANYGLKNGNFEFDMRDGEIRFKSFVDCEGITPDTKIIQNSIYCPAATVQQYIVGIVGIVFGDMNAKEAIRKCEKTPVEELSELLGEDVEEDTDVDAMVARLAERLGISMSELAADEGETVSADSTTEVKTDLFGAKGGNA